MKELIKSIARPVVRKCVHIIERKKYGASYIGSIDKVNDIISETIRSAQPAAIGKIGGFELNVIRDCLRNVSIKSDRWILRKRKLNINAGIFPEDDDLVRDYCNAVLNALDSINVYAAIFNYGEAHITKRYCPEDAVFGNLDGVEPFNCREPWTKTLEGKNVLVVHPFFESIKRQYEKRKLIWRELDILPDFNLMQIKMPLSNALVPTGFEDWRELIDDIKRQMDGFDYDVAIIGAGGYSLLIAQHAKKSGKIGIHIGGSVQILFGIYGDRWLQSPEARKLFNEHWVRPLPEETPPTVKLVENGCYW